VNPVKDPIFITMPTDGASLIASFVDVAPSEGTAP